MLSWWKDPSPKMTLANYYLCQPKGSKLEGPRAGPAFPPDHTAFKMNRPDSCILHRREQQDQCQPYQVPFFYGLTDVKCCL